jgi:ubiquinone/menaquinone biosynthesis C-methylase UbiE
MTDTYKKRKAAEHYDFARALPDETATLWMDKLRKLVPKESITRVLDIGGGTGRFAGLLQETYECPVIVIDPSEEMLEQGRNRGLDDVSWVCGSAEAIPLGDNSVDLVWMSQVFHHLENPTLALKEIQRVLNPAGYLAIRNGTRENGEELEWMRCFPEAQQIDDERIPAQSHITETVCRQGFSIIKLETVYQLFAESYKEYCEKISQRGLSSLVSISDAAFKRGVRRLRAWTAAKPSNQKVYEPIDFFIFRKRE